MTDDILTLEPDEPLVTHAPRKKSRHLPEKQHSSELFRDPFDDLRAELAVMRLSYLKVCRIVQKISGKTKPIRDKRTCYAGAVYLTDREHAEFVKDHGLVNCQTAYANLAAWKEKKGEQDRRSGDRYSLVSWVFKSIKEKGLYVTGSRSGVVL